MSKQNWTDEKLFFRLINNKTENSRWENIQILRSRPSETLFNNCFEFTKSNDPKIRKIGVDILAQLGLPPRPFLNQTLKIYFNLLKVESDPEVLMSLLYSIGHNKDELNKEQIDKICSFIDNNDNRVKKGLVFALLGIDNLNAIDILIKLSYDKLSHIRNWATFGLGTQIESNNKNIREALWKRVNDKHQETKLEAIVGLAKRKDNRVNDIIKREIIGGEYGTLLFDAIIETQNKEFLNLLEQNLRIIRDEKTINPEWEKDLKNCIDKLKKKTKEKRTTA